MPECVRCGAFTDNPADGQYHYCDQCLDDFAEIERAGVIVEQRPDGKYDVLVTDRDASMDGGKELSQVDALARGKYIADKCRVEALFKYRETGSTWVLEQYLREHPDIRQDVHERLRRVPEQTKPGFLKRIREFL